MISCSICLCYLFFFYCQFQISLHLFKDHILIHLLQVTCGYVFANSSGLSWSLLDTALISCVSLEKGDFWAWLCLSLEFIHFSKIWTFFCLVVWFLGPFFACISSLTKIALSGISRDYFIDEIIILIQNMALIKSALKVLQVS